MIDDYYLKGDIRGAGATQVQGLDKKNYYIGTITRVSERDITFQIDNLSLLTHRLLRQSDLIPNTINYYVAIDSITGVFFGEVTQNKIPVGSSRDKIVDEKNEHIISSEADVNILGFEEFDTGAFRLPGFSRPGIAEKVYLANGKIVEHFISSIEVKTQSSDVDTEELEAFACLSDLQETELRLRPSTLFNRHLLAVGATNSGKSTSALSILDKLVLEKKKVLLIDPTGEYKESFTPNEMEKITLGVDTLVRVGELSMRHWAMIFDCNENTQEATLSGAIRSLRYQKKKGLPGILNKVGENCEQIQDKLAQVSREDTDFDIDLLSEQISAEAVEQGTGRLSDSYVQSMFRFNNYQWLNQKIWNSFDNTSFKRFFGNDTTKSNLMERLKAFASTPGTSLYIDASEIGTTDGVGGMVVDLIANFLINLPKNEINPFVIFVDEVHRYAKRINEGGLYYSGLTSVAREGRKKGIFLFLTTQNPNDVSPELLGQIGTLLIHRLTHQNELDAIRNFVDAMTFSQIRKLNQGETILTSVNLLEDLHLSVNRCNREHDNSTPNL